MGDRTEHGGVIIGGSANVFIGGNGGEGISGMPCSQVAADSGSPFYEPFVTGRV